MAKQEVVDQADNKQKRVYRRLVGRSVVRTQAEYVGPVFHRRPEKRFTWLQSRWSRIVEAINETSGLLHFFTLDKTRRIHPSDFPHLPMSESKNIDITDIEKPTLATVRKMKTSTSGVDINQKVRDMGGDPDYIIQKTGGFNFQTTAEELKKKPRVLR
jgi:hypothetical protein